MSSVSVIPADIVSSSDALVEAREKILANKAKDNHWNGLSATSLAQISAYALKKISTIGLIFVACYWLSGYLVLGTFSYSMLWSWEADVVFAIGATLGCGLGLYIEEMNKYDFEKHGERERWRERSAKQLESLEISDSQYVAAGLGDIPNEIRILEAIIEKVGTKGVFYYGAITPRVLQEIFHKEAEKMTIFEVIDYCEYLQSKQAEATELYGPDLLPFTLPTPGDFKHKWQLRDENGLLLQSIAKVAAKLDIDKFESYDLISGQEANFLRCVRAESRRILKDYNDGIAPLQRIYESVINPHMDKRNLTIKMARSKFQLHPAHSSMKRATERFVDKQADVKRRSQEDPAYQAAYVRHQRLVDSLQVDGLNDASREHIELSNRRLMATEKSVAERFAPRYALLQQEYEREIEPIKKQLIASKIECDEAISEAKREFEAKTRASTERFKARISSHQLVLDQACVNINRRFIEACP